MGLLLFIGSSLMGAPGFERAVPCVALENPNGSSSALASDNINSIITEFNILPVLTGRGVRIALAGWGQGTIAENPYPSGHRFANTEKYPGFQESRVLEAPVKAEFAVWDGDKWARVTFGGKPVGVVAPGKHLWSDWGNIPVTKNQPIRARLRIAASDPNFGRLLYSTGYGYDFRYSSSWAGNVAPAVDGLEFKANSFRYFKGGIAGPSISVRPALIQTKTSDPSVRVAVAFGDSILRAANDTGSFANPAGFQYPGWVGRGFRALGIPVVSFAVSGDRSEINTESTMTRRLALMADCAPDYALIQHGINDAAGTSSLSQLRTPAEEILERNSTLAELLKRKGVPKVFLATLTPNTNSSDAWTTREQQKVKKNGYAEANWMAYNRLIKKKTPEGFFAVLDPFSLLGDPTGVWYSGNRNLARTAVVDGDGEVITVAGSSVKDLEQGFYSGYALKATSGLNAGQFVLVERSYGENGKVELAGNARFSNPVRAGDTFTLSLVLTRDGNHPTPEGFRIASQAISSFPNLFR